MKEKMVGSMVSEYEKTRLEKIRRNKALLESLFPDLTESKLKLKTTLSIKRKERRKTFSSPYTVSSSSDSSPISVRRNPGRRARTSLTPSHCPPGATISQSTGVCSLDEDYFATESKRRNYKNYTTSPVKIEFNTEQDVEDRVRNLHKPAHNVWEKKYDRENGSTCHQCRQKTLDGKTKCNNRNCAGVRGQFCGVCLLNRYGENIETAIADKTWVCPPCKGYCNCSMCLTRRGKAPTGILSPIVRHKGFNSVKDYLASFDSELREESQNEAPDLHDEMVSYEPTSVKSESMEYDDENKENIDPKTLASRHKLRNRKCNVVLKRRRSLPLVPLNVHEMDPMVDVANIQQLNTEMETEVETRIEIMEEIIRDKLNVTDQMLQKDIIGELSFTSVSKTKERISSPEASPENQPSNRRAITKCLVIWQSSKYAGGHQWVSPEKILDLDHNNPRLGQEVSVKWGKTGKLHSALLKNVERGLRRRKSCKF